MNTPPAPTTDASNPPYFLAALSDPVSCGNYDRIRAEGNNTTPPSSASPAAAATSLFAMLRNRTFYRDPQPTWPA